MAIFGMNGLYSAGLYVALLFALYGQKNAGFKNNEEVQAIAAIAARKGVAGATKSGGRKAAIAELRRRRFEALKTERYAALSKDPAFQEAYLKKEWVR